MIELFMKETDKYFTNIFSKSIQKNNTLKDDIKEFM